MNVTPTLSIVIPVYNAAKTIGFCVDSIVKSEIDTSNYEIILINDGSTDDSLDVCVNIRNSNNNVQLYSHENLGTSSTRNVGIDNARGEYIWFVDADDYIETSFLKLLLDYLNNHSDNEIICFDYIKGGIRKQDVFTSSTEKGVDFLRDNTRLYLWNHIYKRTTISTLRFLEGTKNIEDWLFNLQIFIDVDRIVHFPQIGYYYCEDNNLSTSRNRCENHLAKLSEDTMLVHAHLKLFLDELQKNDQKVIIEEALNFSVLGHLYSLFMYYTPGKFKEIINKYKDMGLFPVNKTRNKRANLFRIIANRPWLACLLMNFRGLKAF